MYMCMVKRETAETDRTTILSAGWKHVTRCQQEMQHIVVVKEHGN